MTFAEAKRLLSRHGQEPVLRFWDRLSDDARRELLAQLETLDFHNLQRMRDHLRSALGADAVPVGDIEPAPVIRLSDASGTEAVARGEALLRAGAVGAILVAGGQGSRLGYDGPKGCYPVGPVSGASLFGVHARKLLALQRKYGAPVLFYVMTSEVNDDATRAFFDEQGYFGLSADTVRFFKQGVWPALTADGGLVLDRPGHLFMSPDGHGGIIAAMKRNGVLDDMRARGLSTLYFFQVDNPLLAIADPAFIGLHALRGADVSVKVCAKRSADEGLGVVVVRDGRCAVVEYSELSEAQQHATGPDGAQKFLFGSVAIHVFSRTFLEQEADATLPLHLAHKKVPCCDEDGQTVTPDTPNAYKFEKFIFDVIPHASCAVNVEFAREDEFSPVKNVEGTDSPATARRDIVRKFARWFESCGVEVPRGPDGEPAAALEIDPCYALAPADLAARLPRGFGIDGPVLLE